MDNSKEYTLVGGSHNGARVTIGGEVAKGKEFLMPPPTKDGRPEIYVMDSEGHFRFDRHGLVRNPRVGTKAALDEISPILGRLADVLDDLDNVLEKHGGVSIRSEYRVGNWKLRHKDA